MAGRKGIKRRKDPNPAPYVKIIHKGDPEKVDQACRILLDYLSDDDAHRRRSEWGTRTWEKAVQGLESAQVNQPASARVATVLAAYRSARHAALAVLDQRRERYLRFRSQLQDWFAAADIPEGKAALTWLQWHARGNDASEEVVRAATALELDLGADPDHKDAAKWPHDWEAGASTRKPPLAAQASEHLDPQETIEYAFVIGGAPGLGLLLGAKRLYYFEYKTVAYNKHLTRHGAFGYSDVSLTQHRFVTNHHTLAADNNKTLAPLDDERSSFEIELGEEIRQHRLLIRHLSTRLA